MNQKITYKHGVFVLTEKLSSGLSHILSFSVPSGKQMFGMPIDGDIEIPIFNEMAFANWFLVEVTKNKTFADDHLDFLVSEVSNQAGWDTVCRETSKNNITAAILNPCTAKDHKCPIYRFNLKDEPNFDKLKEWLSKCPNTHYTINIGDGAIAADALILRKKPIMGENNTFDFREQL